MTSSSDDIDIKALALFEGSLDQPAHSRADWIRQQAKEDTKMRDKALGYLSHDQSAGGMIGTGGALHETLDDTVMPDQIGAYKITGLIGRGGMGAVYRGERASGDFDHDVAIKVVRPGALSDALISRFQNERQTLAKLSHPNIARLYDGGTAENGSPYIVMEYIDGLPVTEWAETNNLSKNERLKLFQITCKAIGYAHQNLIIHRDITPPNILVDKMGELKIIDFGIAKPFGAESADANVGQNPLGLSFTPGYAAPERTHVSEANTQTDIYSLGKLLSVLMKGFPDDLELKAIINKAAAEDPKDRYEMVNNLEEEINRYRDGFPVEAFANTTGYDTKKFISRHKGSSFLTGITVIGLIIAFSVTVVQYKQADLARSEASTRFNETRTLTNFLLNDIGEELNYLPGTLDLQRQVSETSTQYLNILADAVETDPSLGLEYALALSQLGSVLTDEGGRNLYDPIEGLKQYDLSIDVLTGLASSPIATDEIRNTLANIHMKRTYLYRFYFADLTKLDEAIGIAEPVYISLLEENPEDVEIRTALLHLKFERWTSNVQHASGGGLDLELVKLEREYQSLLTQDYSNYNYVINYSGILSLFLDYASRKWNTPYEIVPISDREEYEFLLSWVVDIFEASQILMERNPSSSEDIYNYFWGLEVLVAYASMGLEWQPSLNTLETWLVPYIVEDQDWEIALELAQKENFSFSENLLYSQKLKGYLDISDKLLRQIEPYDAGAYSYQEVVEQNVISRANIASNLSFDLNLADKYYDAVLKSLDSFLISNANDEHTIFTKLSVQMQHIQLLLKRGKLRNKNNPARVCGYLSDVEETLISREFINIDHTAIDELTEMIKSFNNDLKCV